MGFAQWFWRLFLVFAGLIVAHVLVVTWLVSRHTSAVVSTGEIWLSAAATIAVGGVAMWYCVRQIIEPLTRLSRHVRSGSTSGPIQPGLVDDRDEVGLLTGAFDQMQRDLESRLDQIQDNSQRLAAVLSSMAEGVIAVGPDKTILLANEAGRRLLDFATPNPLGRPLL